MSHPNPVVPAAVETHCPYCSLQCGMRVAGVGRRRPDVGPLPARGKDFGVIATEQGWNLYVGGNGGAVPAHARLLVSDVSTEELIRYLDRFLMYYIRTADRLQRTSTWLGTIDGGLDRVREIVVDDALGLGAELEAEMARHVGSYFDEWKATLEDEGKLSRFVSFVNAPDVPDANISFDTRRGQIAPAVRDEPVALGATIPVGVTDATSAVGAR